MGISDSSHPFVQAWFPLLEAHSIPHHLTLPMVIERRTLKTSINNKEDHFKLNVTTALKKNIAITTFKVNIKLKWTSPLWLFFYVIPKTLKKKQKKLKGDCFNTSPSPHWIFDFIEVKLVVTCQVDYNIWKLVSAKRQKLKGNCATLSHSSVRFFRFAFFFKNWEKNFQFQIYVSQFRLSPQNSVYSSSKRI